MKNDIFGKLRATLLIAISLFAILLLIPVSLLFFAYNSKYSQCVPLKNGLNLGYEAVFDLSRPYFKPISVPRLPDGTPLIRDPIWALFVTDRAVYGVMLAIKGPSDQFAWRSDTGLIQQADNSAAYDQIIATAGPANWDLGQGSIGPEWMLQELIKRPEFHAKRCTTALFSY